MACNCVNTNNTNGCNNCNPPVIDPCNDCVAPSVLQQFNNCNALTWCTEGCEETIPSNCITGCFMDFVILNKGVVDDLQTIEIHPLIFNGGTLGWKLYVNDALIGSYIEPATLTYSANGLVKVIKVVDTQKGCEKVKQYTLLNSLNVNNCYQLTVPKLGASNIYGDIDALTKSDIESTYPDAVVGENNRNIIATLYNLTNVPSPYIHLFAPNFCVNNNNALNCILTQGQVGIYNWVLVECE